MTVLEPTPENQLRETSLVDASLCKVQKISISAEFIFSCPFTTDLFMDWMTNPVPLQVPGIVKSIFLLKMLAQGHLNCHPSGN